VSAAITGLAERGAFRWLEAEKQLAATLDPAAIAKRPIAPGAVRHDHFASSEFRVSLAGEMLRRMERDVSRADCLAH
jgi:CO/xanthine dehydrogenase FAD-binding subunit